MNGTGLTRGWWIGLMAVTVLLVLATLPPFLAAPERSFLYLVFSGACHQIAERSPHLFGVSLAVCHRCYGAYLALPLAALVFRYAGRWDALLNRHAAVLLTISIAVPGVDWLAGLLDVWTNTPFTRVVTGAIFGLTAGYFLSRALTEAFRKRAAATSDVGYPAAVSPETPPGAESG